jgi:Protein of unknown function (DUF3006)
MKAAVDRIEGGVAVLVPCDDSGTTIRLPHILLPDAGEGDIVDLIITRDEAGTAAAREKSRNLVAKLDNKSPR